MRGRCEDLLAGTSVALQPRDPTVEHCDIAHRDDEARVMRQYPHHYVTHAKTPTLVIHGELDYRVPATQGLQYFNSLKAKDVPARLVYFPDENHWILKPQNSRLWYREIFAWLSRFTAPPKWRASR